MKLRNLLPAESSWWFWWYVALFPIVVLLFGIFIGTVIPLLLQSYRTDGHVVLYVGMVVPLFLIAAMITFAPSSEVDDRGRPVDEGWRFAIFASLLV